MKFCKQVTGKSIFTQALMKPAGKTPATAELFRRQRFLEHITQIASTSNRVLKDPLRRARAF
jgi:hypothetical protein